MADDSEIEQEICDNVAEYGWHCVMVFDPDGRQPGFAYSVGFPETLGKPEFIVFGLDAELMHSMLWTAFREMRDGRQIADGERWNGLLEGFDCVIRAVHPTNLMREHFNSAMWFRGDPKINGPLEAMQIIWPDSNDGRFPWDPGCDPVIGELQPALYLPGSRLHRRLGRRHVNRDSPA
jgi:hypothetical protein